MLKEGRPGERKTMIFAPEVLPNWEFLPQMRIVHQLRESNANVNFYTWGDHFTALAATVAADLAGTPYRPVPTINKRTSGRSGLMIVVETPSIDNGAGFDDQRENILAPGSGHIRVPSSAGQPLWPRKPNSHRFASNPHGVRCSYLSE